MPIDNTKLKQLYDTLKQGGYKKDYNNFRTKFLGNENYPYRQKVFNLLSENGEDYGSTYGEFMQRMQVAKPTAASAAPKQPQQIDTLSTIQSARDTIFNPNAAVQPGGNVGVHAGKTAQTQDDAATKPFDVNQANAFVENMRLQNEVAQRQHQNVNDYLQHTAGQFGKNATQLGFKGQSNLGLPLAPKNQDGAFIDALGREYESETEARLAQTGAQHAREALTEANMQHNDPKNYLLEQKARIEKELNARSSQLEGATDRVPSFATGVAGNAMTQAAARLTDKLQDTKYKALTMQLDKVNQALDTLDEAEHAKASDQWIADSSNWIERAGKGVLSFGSATGRSFKIQASKLSNWDFGFSDLAGGLAIFDAVDKADKGGVEALSPEQRKMLDLYAYNNHIQGENKEHLGWGNTAGTVTAQALPFMLEMALNPASGVGKFAQRKAMQWAIKKYGKEKLKQLAKRYLLAKAGTRIAGDWLGAATMSATTGQARVAADAVQRRIGEVETDIDNFGRVTYGGHKNGVDWGEAFGKAFLSNTIENQTEMAGDYFGIIGKAFSKGGQKALDKIGLGFVNDFMRNVSSTKVAKAVTDFENATHWNGTTGEYLEEVLGNVENALMVGDSTFDTDKDTGVFNVDKNIETFLSVAVMGGFFSAVKTASYTAPKKRALNEMADIGRQIDGMLGNNNAALEQWGTWRNTFINGTDEEKKQTLREVMDNQQLPMGFRMAFLEYTKAAQKYHGIAQAEQKRAEEGTLDPIGQALDQAYEEGYGTTEPTERQKAYRRLNEIRSQVAQLLELEEGEDLDEAMGNDPIGYIHTLEEQGFTPEQIQPVLDYANAQATYEGMMQQREDRANEQADAVKREVRQITHRQTGQIQKATLDGGEREVYVLNGKVVLYPDGTGVDKQESDDVLYVQDVQTGELFTIAPNRISELAEPTDPQAVIAEREEAIAAATNQEIAQEEGAEGGTAAPETAGVVAPQGGVSATQQQQIAPTYEIGSRFTLDLPNGSAVNGVVLQVTPDGVEVQTDSPVNGRFVQVFPTDEFDGMLSSVRDEADEVIWSREGAGPVDVEEENQNDAAANGQQREMQGNGIPVDAKTGEPVYEAVAPDVAWDAIVQEAEGDEAMAMQVVTDMVADMEAKVQKAKKAKVRAGSSVRERLEAQKKHKRRIEEAEAQLEAWRRIAAVKAERIAAAERAKIEAADAEGGTGSDAVANGQQRENAETEPFSEDTVGGSPVALAYLLEGGVGSILNAGYFLHGVAAAYPKITNIIERIRASHKEVLGLPPLEFVQNHPDIVAEIEKEIQAAYGQKGTAIYRKLCNNASGFYPRQGVEIGREIESLENAAANDRQTEQPKQGDSTQAAAKEDALKPIGKSIFGNIYDQFKGKVKEAFDFLLEHKSGDLLGVFHRKGVGDIDLIWGDNHAGLAHIINKHIGNGKSFSNMKEFIESITDIINNGNIDFENGDKIVFKKGSKLVTIRTNIRNKGKKIADKNWILTAYDELSADGDVSAIAPINKGQAARTTGKSNSKDTPENRAVQTFGQENAETSLQSEVTRAEQQTNAEPTEGQKEAGNYKKGRVKVGPFDVVIEQPRGSVRSGVDANGKAWETTMQNTYGYFGGTKGVDGDAIDVFLGNDLDGWDGITVFVVDQYNPDGSFDEHKVMLGFNSQEEAEGAYFANYEADWAKTHRTEVTAVPLADFTEWVNSSKRKTKAFAEYKVAKRNAEIDAHNAQNEQLAEQLFSMAKEAETEKDFFDRAASLFEVTGYESDLRDIYNGVKSGEIANARALSFYTNATLKPVKAGVKVKAPKSEQKAEAPRQSGYERKHWHADSSLEEMLAREKYLQNAMSFGTKEMAEVFPMAEEWQRDREELKAKYGDDLKNALPNDVKNAFLKKHRNTFANQTALNDELYELRSAIISHKEKAASRAEAAAKEQKAEEANKRFGDFLNGKTPLRRASIVKALTRVSNFGKEGSMTMAQFIEKHVAEGTLELRTKEVDKLQGPSRRQLNRMDASQQAQAENRVKQAGKKTEYLINGFVANKTAYEYAEHLLATKNGKAGEKPRKHAAQPGAPAVSTQEATLRDALVDVAQQSGLEVVVDEKAQQVLDEVNGRARTMTFGEEYDYDRYPEGRVEPNIADKYVHIERAKLDHGFANFNEAKEWAKSHIVRTLDNEESGGKGNVKISSTAVNKYLSESAVAKSDSKDVHLAVLKKLPEIIHDSVDVETTPDFKKDENGVRKVGNEINKNVLIHRCYGAVEINGNIYRVKITLKEYKDKNEANKAYSYEATKIELFAGTLANDRKTTTDPGTNNSISVAKLLKDVEMSYRPGVKVLEESAKQRAKLREHRVFHGSGAEFSAFDHSHMGEGEGAQAYGWGTYVTEVEGIGRAYARNPWQMKINELESNISRAKEKLPFMPPSATKTELENNIKEWEEELAKLENGNKHLYTVEIPEDNGSNYLHWEEQPGKEQLSAVAEALKADGWSEAEGNHPTFTKGDNKIVLNERATGSDVYAELEESLGSQQKASEFLSSIGFTGISYPAEARSGGRTDAARNFVIFNEKDAQITDHIRFFRTPGGEAYGFTVDGKIYLDPRIATAETPIHEYAHLWADMIRNVNAEAWNDIVGLMKATPIWEEVRGLYPELKTDDEIADEVLAHYSGRRGAERLREAQQQAAAETGKSVFERAAAVAAIERVKQALAKFWQSVAELFHIRFTSAEEVADRVLADMLNGVNPNKVRNSSSVNVAEFAAKHHLNQNDIKKYADSMRSGSLGGASYAFKSIKRSVYLANEGLSLGQFAKVFKPIKNELFSNFGNVEELREEHVQEALNNRNVMEAARKREEAEKEAERKRLEVFEQMSDEALDKAYMEAVRNNDEQRMRDLVNEAARRKGYQSTDEFRMSHRAPSYDEDGTDKSLIDVANNKDNIRDSLEEQFRMNHDRNREESVAAISQAIQEIEQGKNPTVTIYRAVPKSLKEGSVRNGDWVTLSEAYAKQHGRHALNGDYRIMKENVPAANLYWDGNDINEWGYDDKRDYKYKDTRNNRKLNDLIVRDDKGAIIPLSKRFNTRKKDVRFQFVGQQGAAALDKAEEATTRLDNLGVAREMERQEKDAKAIKLATGWERGGDGKWRYEIMDGELKKEPNVKEKVSSDGEVHYETTLGEILDNEQLYRSYPELRTLPVSIQQMDGGVSGIYLPSGYMSLSMGLYRHRTQPGDVRREIEQIESTPEYKEYSKYFEGDMPDAYIGREDEWEEAMNEAEAKFFESELGKRYHDLMWGDKRKAYSYGFDEVGKGVILHEVQHAIQHIEGFAMGGNSTTYREHLAGFREKYEAWSVIDEFEDKSKELGDDARPIDVYNALVREYQSLGLEFGDGFAPSREAFDKGFNLWTRGYDNEGYEDAYNEYQRLMGKFGSGEYNNRYDQLAGEVEARNVQNRLHMTPEERRQSLAEETEDVAREDQIFIMENVGKADSLGDSASFDEHQNEDLKAVNERFNEKILSLRDNPNQKNRVVSLGRAGHILQLGEIADAEIILEYDKLVRKSKEQYKNDHPFDVDDILNLPLYINDPIAIFKETNKVGNSSQVILTELKKNGRNFIVVVKAVEKKRKGGIVLVVNNVTTLFPKEAKGIIYWLNQKKATYVNREKALRFIEALQNHSETKINSKELEDAAKVVENPETSQGSAENNFREGKGELSDDMLSYLNDPMAQMMGKPRGTKKQRAQFAERERGRMQAHAEKLVERLHLTNVEIVTDASQLEGKQRTAKGFYNKRTGKITIVLPNHASTADVEQTLLHEAVAHYGLRQLFGEHFDDFLDMVYRNAEEGIRRKIAEASAKHGWNVRTATEEYLADLAERTDFEHASPQWWAKIKGFFLDMLRGLGFEAMDGQTLTDNELRYVLWRSYENLTESGKYPTFIAEARDVAKQHALQVGRFAPTETAGSRVAENEALSEEEMSEILFRDGSTYNYTQVLARDRYERRIKSGMYQTQEALQDSMLGLRTAMESILEAEGRKGVYIEDIDGFENAYLGENRLSSVNQAEAEKFAREVFAPMLEEVSKLAPTADERAKLIDYLFAKHGLERNEVMARRAAAKEARKEFEKELRTAARAVSKDPLDQDAEDALDDVKQRMQEREDALYSENRQKTDYAGLTTLTGKAAVADAELMAHDMVDTYENAHDTNALWDAINTVTQGTLKKSFDTGMISRDTYDDIRSMYQFYIPLRGFDERTSNEEYSYLGGTESVFTSPIKTAKGRRSKADDPFAYMQMMAESAIAQGNRNQLVKQKLLNFALNHPSDLISVSELWLHRDPVTDQWSVVQPGDLPGTDKLEDSDTAEMVSQKMEQFEQVMQQLALQNPDDFVRQKDRPDIPYRVVNAREMQQHQVMVKRNGKTYVLTINGNPRAAQAVNGLTNPNNDMSGAIGVMARSVESANRWLSSVYTTRNPDFVLTNLARDAGYTNTMVWLKEDSSYAVNFNRNYATRANLVNMIRLYSRLMNGKLDLTDPTEMLFSQFISNGGETGYTAMRDLDAHKTKIKKELKKLSSDPSVRKVWNASFDMLDLFNKAAENSARFAAFITSREAGRTLDRSIYDAKEISVNFNKKGAGAKFLDSYGAQVKNDIRDLSWKNPNLLKLTKDVAIYQTVFSSGVGRSFFAFWNAAIQGSTNFGRVVKRHPKKALTAMAIMFALGLANAMVGASGDDDDDAEEGNGYFDHPSNTRRSNLMLRINGKSWASIPLPVEYRAVYGMGELLGSVMSGKERYTNQELAHEVLCQVSQVLPLDVIGEGSGAFVPTAVKPLYEVVTNESWTGLPIYKQTVYNERDPAYTKAYSNTNKQLVGMSKMLNELSGGDSQKSGWIDVNPAVVEHLGRGYLGGYFNLVDKLVKTGETVVGSREYDPSNLLIVNRFVKSGSERTAYRAINNRYYQIKADSEELIKDYKGYNYETKTGKRDYSQKIAQMNGSPELLSAMAAHEYITEVDKYNKALKSEQDEVLKKRMEKELYELKSAMIHTVDSILDHKQTLRKAE